MPVIAIEMAVVTVASIVVIPVVITIVVMTTVIAVAIVRRVVGQVRPAIEIIPIVIPVIGIMMEWAVVAGQETVMVVIDVISQVPERVVPVVHLDVIGLAAVTVTIATVKVVAASIAVDHLIDHVALGIGIVT
jgi:hypothetical protein